VARNVGFGLHKMARKQRQARVHELLELVGLATRAHAYPHELSGGQQQRVALARALATEPDLLLLDEPFSSLDSELRTQLAVEIRELLKRTGTTAILVTHDQREAFALADHITLLRNGQVEQSGSATALYYQPASRFTATFIGEGHIINSSVGSNGKLAQELECLGQTEWAPGPVQLLIRPEHVTYREGGALKPTVLSKTFQGAQTRYLLQLEDRQTLSCLTSGQVDIAQGKPLPVDIELDKLIPLNGE
jgi:iron(III) transport system ATP-binding protein